MTEAPTRRPRVLFVAHTGTWTGPTNSLCHLLSELRTRIDASVLCPGDGDLRSLLDRQGIPVIELPTLRASEIPAMTRLMRRGAYQLVYANNVSRRSRNAFLAARLCRLPFVVHIRGMALSGKWSKNAFLRWVDAAVAVSEAAARAHAPYLRRPAHVVHNGVRPPEDTVDGTGARAALRRAAGLGPEADVLLSVGHLCRRKGQDLAVEAMAGIAAGAPSAHLVIVGALDRSPAFVEALRARISRAGLTERVTILGFRSDAEALLPGADVFLHTAAADPHPRAVLEAMAAGLPVVAFGVDGVAETVRDGRDGFLVPSGDVEGLAEAALRLLGDPTLRRDMGRAGRSRVAAEFTSARTARRVGDVIGATLAGRRRGP